MGLALVKPNDSEVLDYPKQPKYRPKRGHLIVRKLDRSVLQSGLELPGNMTKSLVEGRVVLVGLPRIENGTELPVDVKIGDVVLYSEPAGLVLDLSDRLLQLLHEENVLAIKAETAE